MKGFFKTYWLECTLFVLGFAGGVIALPFLPEAVPIQWHNGQVSSTGPKWILLGLAVVQLVASVAVHMGVERYFTKFPALAPTLSGSERIVAVMISVVLLSCQLCSMLAAWNVPVNVAVVLLVELVLIPLVFLGFVVVKLMKSFTK